MLQSRGHGVMSHRIQDLYSGILGREGFCLSNFTWHALKLNDAIKL